MGHVLLVNTSTHLSLAILFVVATFWQAKISNDIDRLINSFSYGSMSSKLSLTFLFFFLNFKCRISVLNFRYRMCRIYPQVGFLSLELI